MPIIEILHSSLALALPLPQPHCTKQFTYIPILSTQLSHVTATQNHLLEKLCGFFYNSSIDLNLELSPNTPLYTPHRSHFGCSLLGIYLQTRVTCLSQEIVLFIIFFLFNLLIFFLFFFIFIFQCHFAVSINCQTRYS